MSPKLIMFIEESYFVVIYGLTLLVAILTYRKYFDTILKYFPILIVYTFFNELLGYFIRYYPNFSFFSELPKHGQNDIIYNIYDLIYFGFFFFVYWKLNQTTIYKKWIKIAALLAFSSYLISAFFQNPFEMTLFYATSLSSSILVFCIILYFLDKKKQKEDFIQPNNLMFWVSIGQFVFYTVFPVIFLTGFLKFDLWVKYNLITVLRILIIIMYSIFIIGFLKGSRKAFK